MYIDGLLIRRYFFLQFEIPGTFSELMSLLVLSTSTKTAESFSQFGTIYMCTYRQELGLYNYSILK